MIGIHAVHRRLAEIHQQARRANGYHNLPRSVQREIEDCMAVNADLVVKLDSLKELSFVAYQSGDVEWQQEICQKIDELESKLS